MPEYNIAGIPVQFPFEPYDVQRAYMEKVIACLRDGTNGVLESPTGTGKTLSLLCSSLAWILSRKSDLQRQMQKNQTEVSAQLKVSGDPLIAAINSAGSTGVGMNTANNWGIPKVIYASRTHSQLTQAMQELKRSAYSFMRAVVLGSRDQLCIHPEVMREQGNSNKIQMCKLRIQTKTCSFQSRVESKKDHPDFRGPSVMDIEDLVTVGQKLKMCPYYASKELVNDADITFMPYNYLLDPKALKANRIELNNTIVILDEAHNIEKICEESASVQIRSSDVAMAIEDVTHIMKTFSESNDFGNDEPKDFSLEDLALLKEMLLDLEKAIDQIVVESTTEGTTFPASFIYDLLAKANFTNGNYATILALLDKLVQFLLVASQNGAFRKGGSFQTLSNLLSAVFLHKEDMLQKVYRSFKVHIQIEESKELNPRSGVNKDGWLVKASSSSGVTKAAKVINYWCFNPGFGMEQLLNRQVRSIILTSGTLAPLKPLIAELSIPVAQQLENPHIVSQSQVYVKIIGAGPDREQLISNYKNRDNPNYIRSLGQTVLNVARIVPDGLLVFFPSYPLLNQCINAWQISGLWADISSHKPIYVEPRSKFEFTTVMEQFYQSIRDTKGACFMAVCRGKVSEGLDFADNNGRAVIITGLPFPPLKDPKVILKKRYLEDNRTRENELLSGQDWYNLDATRAVNQAIGRVIRHRHDYGAILLCDARFQYPSQIQQLSKWIRGHLGNAPKISPFGPVVRELREFFKNAEKTLPKPKERIDESLEQQTYKKEAEIADKKGFESAKDMIVAQKRINYRKHIAMKIEETNTIKSWTPDDYAKAAGRQCNSQQVPSATEFISRLDGNVSTIDFNSSTETTMDTKFALVNIHKRERSSPTHQGLPMSSSCCLSDAKASRQKRYKLVDNNTDMLSGSQLLSQPNHVNLKGYSFSKKNQMTASQVAPEDRSEFLRVLRSVLTTDQFGSFSKALFAYKQNDTFEELFLLLIELLGKPQLRYMLLGMRRFLKNDHKNEFDVRLASIDNS